MNLTRGRSIGVLLSLLVAVGMPGCELATSSSSSGKKPGLVPGGDGTGGTPVAAGEPILSSDGVFELYYAVEDFGSSGCVSAWVRNTGPTLSTWKISVGLDRAVTSQTYAAAGDFLVFLYAHELVVVPPDDTKLRSGDVVSIRYCAAPVSAPVDVVVTPREGSLTNPDGATGSPVLTSGSFTLYQSASKTWDGGGCVQMALRNGGPAVTNWALRLLLDRPIESVSDRWGALVQPAGGAQLDVFSATADAVLAKGSSVSFGYCGEPLAFARAIVSITGDETASGGTGSNWPQSPTLSYGQFTLYQSPGADWENGGCVQLMLRNTGAAVDHWALQVRLEAPLTEISSTWGAVIQASGAELLDVFPSNPSQQLAEDGTASFGFCGKPPTYLAAIVSATGEAVTVEQPQNTFGSGSIDDPAKGVTLRYSAPVSAGDGVGCLDLTFQNTGNADLAVTRFVVGLFADCELVNDSWHGDLQKSGTAELTFEWPADFGPTMKKGSEYKTNVCLKPAQKPYVLYVD